MMKTDYLPGLNPGPYLQILQHHGQQYATDEFVSVDEVSIDHVVYYGEVC